MKKSEHKLEHERKKAVRKAGKFEEELEDPQDLVENTTFKKQFRAEPPESKKKKTPKKKVSRNTSTDTVYEETEPDHIHYQNERWSKVQKIKSETNTKRFKTKGEKYKNQD